MNPMNQGARGGNVDARHRVMLIVWFAILMSVGVMFSITLVLKPPPADPNNNTLLWAFAVISVFLLLLSFVIKRRQLAQSVRDQRVDLVQSAMIVAVALCESVGLLGGMLYLTTAFPYYYVFFIASVIGILLHMPRRDQILSASYKAQV